MMTTSLCFAGQASVPATLTVGYRIEDGVDFYVSEKVILQRIEAGKTPVEVTPLEIQNWSETKALQLVQIQIVPENNWFLMEKADFDAKEETARKLYLYLEESTGSADAGSTPHVFTYDAADPTQGVYKPTNFTIAVKGTRSITFQGEAGLYEKTFENEVLVEENVAKAIVTLAAVS
jgi:hypothetical protein